jgi:hypothetical protein
MNFPLPACPLSGMSGKQLLALSIFRFDPSRTLAFRHASQTHAFANPLPPRKICWIVAEFVGTQAADGIARVERKCRLRSGSRLIYRAEQPQGRGQRKMGNREIAVRRPRHCGSGCAFSKEEQS